MSGHSISNSDTRLDALKLQSSAYGIVIPLMWGVNQVAPNLVWYGGLKAIANTTSQGGKGGVKAQNTTFTYTASVLMGLIEGRIVDVPRAWRGSAMFSGGIVPSQILTATESFSGTAGTRTVSHAATFAADVSVTTVLGSGVDTYTATLQLGEDYSVSAGVYTILASWPSTISITYQYISGSYTQTALAAMGLTFLAGELGQSPWSGLASYGTQSIGYSGLAAVAGADYDVGTTAEVANHLFEVVGPMAYHLGSTLPDVDPTVMLRDLLTDARGGANFPGTLLDVWQQLSDFCVASGILVSPVLTTQQSAAHIVQTCADMVNAMPVWSSGRLKMIPRADVAVTGNGRTYTPVTTPAFNLDDNSYVPAEGQPPVRMHLVTPADRFNHIKVEFRDRDIQYNVAIAEAKDQSDIELNGLRTRDTIDAKQWLAWGSAARTCAEILKQRSLSVTAKYDFELPWYYARLEPGDICTLTDNGLGLSAAGVIVTQIEEGADGQMKVTAEDYPAGSNAPGTYTQATPAGYQRDYNVAPGNTGTPIVFEMPPELTSTGLGVYIAVPNTGINANWGGAQVWLSLDGVNYQMQGVIYGGARVGALNGATSAGSSTVAVNGLGAQQLLSGSASDLATLKTLCYIGGANPEYFAYTTATLTGPGAYTLGTLAHGAYGTPALAHANADAFVRVDERVLKSEDLDRTMIGKTLYVKVCSFNLYGGAQQSLADVSATTYAVAGTMVGYRAVTERGNLLDSSSWANGGSGSQGFFGGNRWVQATPAGTNIIGLSGTPDGALRLIWQADSTGTSSYAGWESYAPAGFAINPTEVIRYSIWVKNTTIGATPGTLYFGPASGGSTALVPSGAQETNPYFATFARGNFVQGRWYLLVGFVLPATSGTTQQNKGGIYDGVTGQKVANLLDYKWRTDAVSSGHRVFMFGASSGDRCEFWSPRADLCDGTEPDIDALLAVAKQSNASVSAVDFATAIGLNGQFTNWALAQTYPDGWLDLFGTGIIKETTITRTGPNAARFNVASGQAGSYFVWTPSQPLKAGSYLRVSADMYIAANTSGPGPSVLVELYTNAGFSTYRSTLLQPPSLATGFWQTVSANAAVRSGEVIYRIIFYLMASWSGIGNWVGQVVFDSLLVDMMAPTDTDHLASNAATDTLLSEGNSTVVSPHLTVADYVDTLCSLSYTNTTGRNIKAQIEASCFELYLYSPNTLTVRKIQVTVSGAASNNGTFDVHRHIETVYAGNDPGSTATFEWTIAAGGTLVVNLERHSAVAPGSIPSGAEVNGNGRLRGTFIKV